MRIAYLDCFSGVSGDMLLGGFLDLGVDLPAMEKMLARLPMSGYKLQVGKQARGHLHGTAVEVLITGEDHPHRRAGTIMAMIAASALPEQVKHNSMTVFKRLAEAEGKIHGIAPDDVHFHEVGAVDSIVDIVGTCIAVHLLKIEQLVSSPLPLGRGFVHCAHGRLPLPAPATLALLQGIPTYDGGQERELVTPTGAALISTLCTEFGGFPAMRIEACGYGVGHHPQDDPPNLLRVVLGRTATTLTKERLLLLETSIDDMNPEFYGHLLERLLENGALDVNIVPVLMKKNRPGQLLRVLCPQEAQVDLMDLILAETTSLGVRLLEVERYRLPRTTYQVSTRFGRLRVKVGLGPDNHRLLAPEYDSCRRAAKRWGVPLREVYAEALAAAQKRAHDQAKKTA